MCHDTLLLLRTATRHLIPSSKLRLSIVCKGCACAAVLLTERAVVWVHSCAAIAAMRLCAACSAYTSSGQDPHTAM